MKLVTELTETEQTAFTEQIGKGIEQFSLWTLPNNQTVLINSKTQYHYLLTEKEGKEFQKKLAGLIFRTIRDKK